MARSRIDDLMQSHRFWLLDIMPSATFPFLVLGSPLLGFQAITAPEITLETVPVEQVNSVWKKHLYTGGEAGPITLTRGTRWYDGTFYDWIRRAQRGYDNPNRDLLLIHYMGLGTGYIRDKVNLLGNEKGKRDVAEFFAPGDGIQHIPGRAWILWDAVPSRYKAGTDFDATSGEVSLMELDIQPYAIEELSLV